MGFRKTQWLFPVAVTLHNSEEALAMPKWVAVHSRQLPVHPGATKIWFGLLLLTLGGLRRHCSERAKGQRQPMGLFAVWICGRHAGERFHTSHPGNLGLPRIHARRSHCSLDKPPDHEHSLIPGSTRAVGVGDEGNRLRSAGSAHDRRGDFGAVRASLKYFVPALVFSGTHGGGAASKHRSQTPKCDGRDQKIAPH